jgi:hypothetical protein
MRVWVVLRDEEESKYLAIRQNSSVPEATLAGEEVVVDGGNKCVHHMDDQGGWEYCAVLRPLFKPEINRQKNIGAALLDTNTPNVGATPN